MTHTLPPLPYALAALAPHISAETLEFHHGKHHAKYVATLNELIPNTEFAENSLEEIIHAAPEGPLFNNAAQVWNHAFYWNCLAPAAGGEPAGDLLAALTKNFGSFQKFREEFTTVATKFFGSGWVWLVKKADGSLAIVSTGNAGCPLRAGEVPLLTCDVWEHAYYIDYRNARPQYIEVFWRLVNWKFVAENLAR